VTTEWRARPEGPEYEAVRQRLVDSAESIVRDRGVGALRLDAVAEDAGLHRSSVYRYFASKEDLLTAVVVQATARVRANVIERMGPRATPAQILTEGLAMALAELATDPVHRALSAPAASEAMARVSGNALTNGIRPLLDPLFAAAEEQGLLRPGIDPDEASRWLLIVATGLWRSPELVPDPDELTVLLGRVLVPALLATPDPA
jgi:AcrR family transcriptional regulator